MVCDAPVGANLRITTTFQVQDLVNSEFLMGMRLIETFDDGSGRQEIVVTVGPA